MFVSVNHRANCQIFVTTGVPVARKPLSARSSGLPAVTVTTGVAYLRRSSSQGNARRSLSPSSRIARSTGVSPGGVFNHGFLECGSCCADGGDKTA
jgi:hypothetical protein